MPGVASRPLRRGGWLLNVHTERWQQALHNGGKADESHQDFQQISKPPTSHKSIDEIKANCANNDDDQDIYEQHKHRLSPRFGATPGAPFDSIGPPSGNIASGDITWDAHQDMMQTRHSKHAAPV